jgi:hypothetical protein
MGNVMNNEEIYNPKHFQEIIDKLREKVGHKNYKL